MNSRTWVRRTSGPARRAAILLLGGCAFGTADAPPGDLRGARLLAPVPRPEFVLRTPSGSAFDFRRETAGTVTLVFFGFTQCPDVCPVTMGTLSAVLADLAPEVAGRIRLVFVTTDPGRDTGPVLTEWLQRVAPAAIGLTGRRDEIQRAERLLGLPASTVDSAAGRYEVGHPAQVVVFTADDSAHFAYPFGTRQTDWAADLPKLVAWRSRP